MAVDGSRAWPVEGTKPLSRTGSKGLAEHGKLRSGSQVRSLVVEEPAEVVDDLMKLIRVKSQEFQQWCLSQGLPEMPAQPLLGCTSSNPAPLLQIAPLRDLRFLF